MTDQALDDLARRVMLDAVRQEYGSLMEELPEHDFSPEFERKMQKLVCRAKHPIWHRAAQAAACLLLAILPGAGAVLTVSPKARAAFTGWVREVYETSFIYRFFGTEPETLGNVIYRPTYAPDGWRIERMSSAIEWIIRQAESGRPIEDPGREYLGGLIHVEVALSACIDLYNSTYAS